MWPDEQEAESEAASVSITSSMTGAMAEWKADGRLADVICFCLCPGTVLSHVIFRVCYSKRTWNIKGKNPPIPYAHKQAQRL